MSVVPNLLSPLPSPKPPLAALLTVVLALMAKPRRASPETSRPPEGAEE